MEDKSAEPQDPVSRFHAEMEAFFVGLSFGVIIGLIGGWLT